MKNPFELGDKKFYKKIVGTEETASFDSGEVHPFYATFALGRDAEWACRLFVLDMKETHEEGIGTFLHINHRSPAQVGDEVIFEATIEEVNGNEVICSYKAQVKERLIAEGKTGQKILTKNKLQNLIKSLES